MLGLIVAAIVFLICVNTKIRYTPHAHALFTLKKCNASGSGNQFHFLAILFLEKTNSVQTVMQVRDIVIFPPPSPAI